MDAIISDCGIILYGFKWWRNLGDAEWAAILAAAKRADYSYRHIMRRIQRAINSYEDVRVKFNVLVDVAKNQHRRIYKWFKSKHGRDSWLGVVPADIRGIIDHYLHMRVAARNSIKTAAMGMLHSIGDAPAVQKLNRMQYKRKLVWYHLGKWHRAGAPACIESVHDIRIVCHWFEYGYDIEDVNMVHVIMITDNRVTYYGVHGSRPAAPDAATEAVEICRRDLGLQVLD